MLKNAEKSSGRVQMPVQEWTKGKYFYVILKLKLNTALFVCAFFCIHLVIENISYLSLCLVAILKITVRSFSNKYRTEVIKLYFATYIVHQSYLLHDVFHL